MQIKKERKQTYRYSYTQLAVIKPAKAPGQDSIGTGGQNSIGANSIAQMSVIFALLSATLHQLWFFYNAVSDNFLHSTVVMAIGNLLGTIVVLCLIKVTSGTFKRNASPFE